MDACIGVCVCVCVRVHACACAYVLACAWLYAMRVHVCMCALLLILQEERQKNIMRMGAGRCGPALQVRDMFVSGGQRPLGMLLLDYAGEMSVYGSAKEPPCMFPPSPSLVELAVEASVLYAP